MRASSRRRGLGRAAFLGVAAFALAGCVGAVASGPVAGASGPSARKVSLTLSFPPLFPPANLAAGASETSHLEVTNTGTTGTEVLIEPATATPRNNGETGFGAGTPPLFRSGGSVVIAPRRFYLASGETAPFTVTVRAPKDLGAGIYLLGVLAVPEPKGGGVHDVTAVGGLVDAQVPGRTDARLEGTWTGPSGIELGDHGWGSVRLSDPTKTAFYAFGYTTFAASMGRAPGSRTIAPTLFAPGRSRALGFDWTGGFFGLGRFRVVTTVEWNVTPKKTVETVVSHSVWVVPWWAVGVASLLLVVVLGAAALLVRRTLRRRGAKAGKGARRTVSPRAPKPPRAPRAAAEAGGERVAVPVGEGPGGPQDAGGEVPDPAGRGRQAKAPAHLA